MESVLAQVDPHQAGGAGGRGHRHHRVVLVLGVVHHVTCHVYHVTGHLDVGHHGHLILAAWEVVRDANPREYMQLRFDTCPPNLNSCGADLFQCQFIFSVFIGA